MYRARVEFSFDAGHRLLGYSGKCASPHGHTFQAEVFIAVAELNSLGLTLDFVAIKQQLKQWIDQHWDHGFLLNEADTVLIDAFRQLPESKVYLFRGINPSTEAMACALYDVAHCAFGDVIEAVRIWESAKQYAEYRPESAAGAASRADLPG